MFLTFDENQSINNSIFYAEYFKGMPSKVKSSNKSITE